jgi:hypothetical protein
MCIRETPVRISAGTPAVVNDSFKSFRVYRTRKILSLDLVASEILANFFEIMTLGGSADEDSSKPKVRAEELE